MIKSIYEFNTQLLGVKTGNPKLLDKSELDWLLVALNEEIQELVEADEKRSLVDCIDSVLDLAYFAVGACVRMGLTEEQIEGCFRAIHHANMTKKMGVKESRPQDGSIADAVKPIGWQPPEKAIENIVYRKGTQMEMDL